MLSSLTTEILDLKLCYVADNWAYFTSCDIHDQWGDDWDDSPYEHNAGPPYSDNEEVSHTIFMVAFTGQVDPPCASYANSHWSVEQINNGDVPWLSNQFFTSDKVDSIYAGTSLREFIEYIKRNEGDVFLPLNIVAGSVDEKNLKVGFFRGEFG